MEVHSGASGLRMVMLVVMAFCALPIAAKAKSSKKLVCLDQSYTGVGESIRKDVAQERAIEAWREVVTLAEGQHWAALAPKGQMECIPTQHNFHCWIEARPCRLLPVDAPAEAPGVRLQLSPSN